jgi:hypothetical protein
VAGRRRTSAALSVRIMWASCGGRRSTSISSCSRYSGDGEERRTVGCAGSAALRGQEVVRVRARGARRAARRTDARNIMVMSGSTGIIRAGIGTAESSQTILSLQPPCPKSHSPSADPPPCPGMPPRAQSRIPTSKSPPCPATSHKTRPRAVLSVAVAPLHPLDTTSQTPATRTMSLRTSSCPPLTRWALSGVFPLPAPLHSHLNSRQSFFTTCLVLVSTRARKFPRGLSSFPH